MTRDGIIERIAALARKSGYDVALRKDAHQAAFAIRDDDGADAMAMQHVGGFPHGARRRDRHDVAALAGQNVFDAHLRLPISAARFQAC